MVKVSIIMSSDSNLQVMSENIKSLVVMDYQKQLESAVIKKAERLENPGCESYIIEQTDNAERIKI